MSMLLDNEYTIIPQLRFTLTYANDIRKSVLVKTNDIINCFYKKDGVKANIIGKVTKIACNFNSSLGAVGTTVYMQVDGSSEYDGQVEFIQPSNVLDITIVSTTDVINNVICSVDNETQRVSLIRENEVGALQYSLDGQIWKGITASQGKSAYECAVELGFKGTEEEWLASLVGPKGETGEAGGTKISGVYESVEDLAASAMFNAAGTLVALQATPSSLLYVRNNDAASTTFTPATTEIDGKQIPTVTGYTYVGELSIVGPKGETGAQGPQGVAGVNGKDGKSAYQAAVDAGYAKSETEFNQALAHIGETVAVTYDAELNATSENAVQNKVIYAKIQDLQKQIDSGSTGSGDSPVVVADTYYGMASECNLTHTVIGPVRLVIYGWTKDTMESIAVNSISFSDGNEEEKTLQFPEPVVLRSVPNEAGSCPNVIIDGKPHIADFIAEMNGQIGVTRRVAYVESYSGECILGDWMSSTGALDLGATVQYAVYGTFEPFDQEVQDQYRALKCYEGSLHVRVMEDTNISVTYPIDVITYINDTVKNAISSEGQEELINQVVTEKVGDIGEYDTVAEYVDAKVSAAGSDKVGTLPEGKNTVMEVIGTVDSGTVMDAVNAATSTANDASNAVQTLNGGNETPGSVDYKIEQALADFQGGLQADDITTGTTNGTITVDGTEVAVAGLKTAAYAETTAFDAAGAAAAVEAKIGDLEESATVAEYVQAKVKAAIDDLISELVIPPEYTEPTLVATATEGELANVVEVGTSVTPKLTATFTQNDAGALTEIKIQKNGSDVPGATNASSPYEWTGSAENVAEGTTEYSAVATYAEGAIEKDNLNRDYPEGHIEAGSITAAEKLTYTGKRKVFYGATADASAPTVDSAFVRGLSDGTLTYNMEAPNEAIITMTASTSTTAAIAMPAPLTLTAATQGEEATDVLAQFILTGEVQVNDAAGANPVAYNVYVLHQAAAVAAETVYTLTYGPAANAAARVRRTRSK